MKIGPSVDDFKTEWEKPDNEVSPMYGDIRLGTKFIQFILRAFGTKQLTPEEKERLTSQTYPSIFALYRFLLGIVYLATTIGLILYLHFKFSEIQRFFFEKDAILFSSGSSIIFTLVNMFGIFLLGGTIISLLLLVLSPQRFKDYDTTIDVVTGWVFDQKVLAKIALVSSVVYYLIFSQIIFFSLRDYTAVYPNKVVANEFFSFKDKNYGFSDIRSVKAFSEYIDYKDNRSKQVYLNLIFSFTDGRKVNFLDDAVFTKYDQSIKNLYRKLNEKNITVEISPPSEQIIKFVQTDWCPTKQRNFYALFKLNYPVNSNPSCFQS